MDTMMLEAAMQQFGNEAFHLYSTIAVVTALLLTVAWMAAGLLRTPREL